MAAGRCRSVHPYNLPMSDQHITIPVARGVEDLIPTFLKNRAAEIATLRTALAAGDFEELGRLGHRMKGVGEPYGFERVSLLGRQIQDDARSGNGEAIAQRVSEYADYLGRVRIVYR